MKKASKNQRGNNMLSEYDFSHGVRGKYAHRYAQGSNVVLLDKDVAKVFPTAEEVNQVLRAIAGVIRTQARS